MKSLGDIYKIRKCDLDNYLSKKWKNHNCPMCDTLDWVSFYPKYEKSDEKFMHVINQYYLCNDGIKRFSPTVPLMCKNCGYTIYISLVVTDLSYENLE